MYNVNVIPRSYSNRLTDANEGHKRIDRRIGKVGNLGSDYEWYTMKKH